jgi:hypothetical protein
MRYSARSCIRAGSRGRFFHTVDLVNRLGSRPQEAAHGRRRSPAVRPRPAVPVAAAQPAGAAQGGVEGE